MPPNTNFLITTNPSPAVAGTTRRSLAALLLMAAPTGGTGGVGGVGAAGGVGGVGGAGSLDVLPNGCTGTCWSYMGFGPGSGYHNPNETVLSVDNVAMLEAIWTTDVGGSATGAAAAVGDTVYFASQGKLVALDRANVP